MATTLQDLLAFFARPHRPQERAEGGRGAADEAAVRERVDNTRVTLLRSPGFGMGAHRGGRTRAAFEIMKLWENGRTLRCKFIDGQPEVQAKVEAIAKEWEEFANLKLKFVTSGAAEIRISFPEKGFSWSTMGTDALTVGASEADHEVWLARAEHRAARIPARRAPRVRPCDRPDPRAPEPGRAGQDPLGQAEGLRVLRAAGLEQAGHRLQHLRGLFRRQHQPQRASIRRRSWSTRCPTS